MVNLDNDSKLQLNKRSDIGRYCMNRAWGSVPNVDDRVAAAKDAISAILTALYGPAGYFIPVENGLPERVVNQDAQIKAALLLNDAHNSYLGDAEDYTSA